MVTLEEMNFHGRYLKNLHIDSNASTSNAEGKKIALVKMLPEMSIDYFYTMAIF